MMGMIRERLKVPVEPVEAVGLDGDMLEAQAFAYLAVRVIRGIADLRPRDDRLPRAGLWRAGVLPGSVTHMLRSQPIVYKG